MNPKSAKRPLTAIALFLATAAIASAQAPSIHDIPAGRRVQVDKAYGSLPLQFEENRGQVSGTAKFLSRGPGYSILLQPDTATFVLRKPESRTAKEILTKPAHMHGEVIRMSLTGTSNTAAIAAQQPLKGYVNYMTGPDRSTWKLGVPTYAQTRVSAAYPGIDLVYYGNQKQLEYDFLVAPGADATKIRFFIAGATPVLASDGRLLLQTRQKASVDDLSFQKPVLYQQIDGKRLPVQGSYAIASNGEVSFTVGSYDHGHELVIDPIISYASYFGTAAEEEINGSALNASNQLYAVGQTLGTTLPGTAGEFETGPAANNNGHDAFVTKFSADGSSVLWTTYLSGAGDDFATSVAVNANDQPYIVGYTASCGDGGTSYNTAGEFPFVGGVQALCNADDRGFNNYESNGAGYDAFLVKLSSDGKSELYGTPLGGTANDIASGVVLDAAGRVYIVGETFSTQYVLSPRSNDYGYQDVPSYPINNHGVVGVPGPSNYPTTASAYYTNTTESKQYAVSYPNGGNGIIAGTTVGPQDEQAFVTVLSADLGTILYSSLIGGGVIGGCGNGNCNTNGLAIAVNANGVVYIGGNTSSAHWPTTVGAFAATCSNAGAATSQCPMTGWLAAFDSTKSGNASLLFSTYLTGSSGGKDSSGNNLYPGSDVFGLATDSTGNVIATGDTSANNFPTTAGTLQPACVQFSDGNGNTGRCAGSFITKLSPAGATVWSTYYGATTQNGGGVIGQAVALDQGDNVFVLGTSTSPNLMLKNAISTNIYSQNDAYLIELSPTASNLQMGTFLGSGGGIIINSNALHLDSDLNAYFSGYQGVNPYGGTSFPITANAYDKVIQYVDGFVVKMITQQQPSATALTVSPNPATPSQTVTLTATVTTSSTLTGTLLPTGAVTFYNGTSVVGTAKLNSAGVATYAGTLAGGSYSITANYAGDTGFNGSVSSPSSLTVSSATTTATTLTVSPAISTYGTTENLTATVQAGTTAATAGTVTFTAGSVTLGIASVNAQGVATTTVTPNAGTYSVIASYAGTYNPTSNANGFGPSTSSATTLTITKAASTTALTASNLSPGVSANITLTATVPSSATGTITFYNGTTSLGQKAISSGAATLSTSFAVAGSYSITAVYSGDPNYNGSTSTAITERVVVPGFTVAASPSSLTVARGSTGSTTLTLSPTGGFTGTITLSCGTLPTDVTCMFAPTTITINGAMVTDALTIDTGSLTAMLSKPKADTNHHSSIAVAILFGMPGSLLGLFGLSKRKTLHGCISQIVLMGTLGVITIGAMAGCSGSTPAPAASTNATPAGSYQLTVTASGGGVNQTVPLTLVVQ